MEQAQADALVAEGDNLICQAIINSGIALEAVNETEEVEEAEEQALDGMPKEVLQVRDVEGRMTEIQVMEECVEMEAEEMVVS